MIDCTLQKRLISSRLHFKLENNIAVNMMSDGKSKSQSSDKERSKKWPKESKNVLTPPPFFHKDLSPGILGLAVGRPWVGRGSVSSPLVEKFQKLY